MKKFKNLREQFLSEALSRKFNDDDVKTYEKRWGTMEPDQKEDYMKNSFSPIGSARPEAWLALSYPVRSGDYYFALMGNKGTATKWNSKINDFMKKAKKVHPKDPEELFRYVERWVETNVPSKMGAGDTMTREEIYASCLDILRMRVATGFEPMDDDVDVTEGRIKKFLKKFKRGLRLLKPKMPRKLLRASNCESVNEASFSAGLVKRAVKIAMDMEDNMTGAIKKIERMKRGLSDDKAVQDALRLANESVIQLSSSDLTNALRNEARQMTGKQISRKFGRVLKKAVRTGQLELPADAEEALYMYALDQGEIKTDDPDEFTDWLEKNIEDFADGKVS